MGLEEWKENKKKCKETPRAGGGEKEKRILTFPNLIPNQDYGAFRGRRTGKN